MSTYRLMIMGPPGAGKGTQAKLLVDHFGFAHLATGDILRAEVKGGTDLGKQAKAFMDRGDLVPDSLINAMIGAHIQKSLAKGFLLDGFPRTVPQAEAIDDYLSEHEIPIDAIFNIQVDQDLVVDRIVNRITCVGCGAAFHAVSNPPKEEGICDHCGGKTQRRADDEESKIRNRLNEYNTKTQPVVDYYRGKTGLVQDVDGQRAIEAVQEELRAKIGSIAD